MLVTYPTSKIKIHRKTKTIVSEDWRDEVLDSEETVEIEEIDGVLVQEITEDDVVRFGDLLGNYSLKIYIPRGKKIDKEAKGSKVEVNGSFFTLNFLSVEKEYLPQRYRFSSFIIVGDESVK